MAIEQWQVYHVQNCRHAKPAPKDKFVVVACLDNSVPYGFFINSLIGNYIQKRPLLLVCEARILQAEHSFLAYDSWVDCTGIYAYTVSELQNYRGTLSPNGVQVVMNSVAKCSTLTRRYKRMIQEQHNP